MGKPPMCKQTTRWLVKNRRRPYSDFITLKKPHLAAIRPRKGTVSPSFDSEG
jgi:hypothetical protein